MCAGRRGHRRTGAIRCIGRRHFPTMGPQDMPDFEAMSLHQLLPFWSKILWWNGVRPMQERMLKTDLSMAESMVLHSLQYGQADSDHHRHLHGGARQHRRERGHPHPGQSVPRSPFHFAVDGHRLCPGPGGGDPAGGAALRSLQCQGGLPDLGRPLHRRLGALRHRPGQQHADPVQGATGHGRRLRAPGRYGLHLQAQPAE